MGTWITVDSAGLTRLLQDLSGRASAIRGVWLKIRPANEVTERFRVYLSWSDKSYLMKHVIPQRSIEDYYGSI